MQGTLGLSAYPVVMVMAIAVLSSLLAEVRIGAIWVPVVVWEMLCGMLLGPHGLNLARNAELIEWFGHQAGLAALFFMAGMDLDLQKVKGRPIRLAARGWTLSLVLGLAAAIILHFVPAIRTSLVVGLVLTTTALGTFMPILRDTGHLDSKFGSFVTAAGAAGEFCPILVVAVLLTRLFSAGEEVVFTFVFLALSVGAALIALGLRPPKILKLLERTMDSSTQLPVAFSVLLLAAFANLSQAIGLESVLGSFAAGMVVGLASQGDAGRAFRHKMEAICFGFLIPFFFVVSGMNLDVGAFVRHRKTMLLTPIFLLLFLVVRGAPVVFYRRDLPKYEWLPFALYSATALPMVVAITDIAVRTNRLQPEIAAALVGAGLLSVLLFPAVASSLLTREHKLATAACGS